MRIGIQSQVAIELNSRETSEQLKKRIKVVMEIAAIKALEAAVERTPAAGETQYSTGHLRQSIRVRHLSDNEFELAVPMNYAMFLEFGTGPRGLASGSISEFPDDPVIRYHSGEVIVTRARGKLLDEPYIRRTQGMLAQPFLRPALIRAVEVIKEFLSPNN